MSSKINNVPKCASPRPSISHKVRRATVARVNSHHRCGVALQRLIDQYIFQRNPGITGVTVLEHLERLDVIEAGLQRLGVDEPLMEVDEVDVGESSHPRPPALSIRTDGHQEAPQDMPASEQFTPPESPGGLTSVTEDLAGMSESMSHAELPFPFSHMRWKSHIGSTGKQPDRTLDWMNLDENEQRK